MQKYYIYRYYNNLCFCNASFAKNQVFIPPYTRIICHVFKVPPFNLYRNTVYIHSNYTVFQRNCNLHSHARIST